MINRDDRKILQKVLGATKADILTFNKLNSYHFDTVHFETLLKSLGDCKSSLYDVITILRAIKLEMKITIPAVDFYNFVGAVKKQGFDNETIISTYITTARFEKSLKKDKK